MDKQYAQNALKEFSQFSERCEETGYTDTGEAWSHMNTLAALVTRMLVEDTEDCEMPIYAGPIGKIVPQEERNDNLTEVIDRRVQVYGDPVVGFAEIAQMWSVFLGHDVQAWEVPIMMALMKIVRMKASPDYSDHSDDIEGYIDIFRKVMGPDMVRARSVNEYIEKKWPDD